MGIFLATAKGALSGGVAEAFTLAGMGIDFVSKICSGDATDGQKKCTTVSSQEELASKLETPLSNLDPIDSATRNGLQEGFHDMQRHFIDKLFDNSNGRFLNEVYAYLGLTS